MPVYPTSNPAWICPVVRSLKFTTGIAQGVNGTEQRWMLTTGVESWSLPYDKLSVTQRDNLLAVFATSKGAYVQTLSLVFNGTTYSGLSFDTDALEFTETSNTLFAGTVKLTTAARAADSGGLPADVPTAAADLAQNLDSK